MRKLLLLLSVVLFVSCASTSKNTPSIIVNKETANMSDLFQTVDEKAKKYGVENVLIVFDIDNTILTMENMLGSDQWFSWQEKMFWSKSKDCAKYCVANDFDKMLDVQGQLFALAPMVPTEKDLPAKIKSLQDRGFKVILLTSRGKEFRNSTENELKRNGYNLLPSAIGGAGFAGHYYPYDTSDLSAFGLGESDKEADKRIAKMKKARKVSYMNGVYMTAGQHKGTMLKTLLHKTGTSFKAIIFADDHKKHTVRMSATFKNEGIDLTTFRYSRIDPIVEKFKKGSKKKVHAQWMKLKKTINSIYK
jgi:predicted Fe-Mo cluster-binding NifX family protein